MDDNTGKNILFLECCSCRDDSVKKMLLRNNFKVVPVVLEELETLDPEKRNRADLIIITIDRDQLEIIDLGKIYLSGYDIVPVIFIMCGPVSGNEVYPEDLPVYACFEKSSDPAVILSAVNLALKWSLKNSSERMYEILINGMVEGVFVIDFEGNIIDINDNAIKTLGYSREEIYSLGLPAIDSSLSPEKIKGMAGSMPADEVQIFETTHKAKDGREFPVEVVSSIITYRGSKAILSMARDITNRKQMEGQIRRQLAEKEILIKATHHRVKNNIASIQALLSLQKAGTKNPEVKEALTEAAGRIQCMQVLYDILLKHDAGLSVKNYLEALRDSILDLYSKPENVLVESRIEDITLDEKIIFPLGVVFEELLTNIMKYAFTENSEGRIEIVFGKENDSAKLTVRDNGKGLPENLEEVEGFGIMIVRILSEQLEADFNMINDSGSCSTFKFKI